MYIGDFVFIILRYGELAFAAIVAGLTGDYLHAVRHSPTRDQGRFIYTEVIAGLSILLSIVLLIPYPDIFFRWAVDLLLSVAWFVAFGLLVNWLDGSCGNVFDWTGIAIGGGSQCAKWKANLAFCFLSAICWLASALLGLYWVYRQRATRHRRYRPRV